MTTGYRWGNLRTNGDLKAKLEAWQRSPSGRAQLARVANRESKIVAEIAAEVAEEDLHQREDPSRRSPLSVGHGKRLHESFEPVPAKEVGYKLRAAVRNTHPAFPMVEGGTAPHVITGGRNPSGKLVFPWDGTRGLHGGSPGQKGTFAVNWGDSPNFVGPTVDHPGAKARNILPRAVRRYRRRRNV